MGPFFVVAFLERVESRCAARAAWGSIIVGVRNFWMEQV